MKYTLVALRNLGVATTGYYKADPENPWEEPIKIVVFLPELPPLTIEGEMVEYKLDGIYKYPNGKRTDTIHVFCRKTKSGSYLRGFSPQEQIAKRLTQLMKVGELLTFIILSLFMSHCGRNRISLLLSIAAKAA